ncbi:MAG: stage II sporulation protein R [Clostridia bacterium]|nr:stage II sporulation protein R [Clostridia bacterium]
MKRNILIIIILFFVIFSVALFLPEQKDYDYLRIHIRANSNLTIDQNVKYQVKDELVNFLSPYLSNVSSKNDAINIINKLKINMEKICDEKLKENNFNYCAKIKIDNEYFPTRSYNNITLEAGYYDAVIVELGEAVGDNWWCIMYPPLCFVNKNENSMQIKYKSKLVEWFKNMFN